MKAFAVLGRLLARLWVALRVLLRLGRTAPAVSAERAEREAQREQDDDPRERRIVSTPRRELAVVALLVASSLCAIGFVIAVLIGDLTQVEGLTLGGAFLFVGVALGLLGTKVLPQVTDSEPRPKLEHPGLNEPVREELAQGVEGISRRKLLTAAGIGTGGALTAAIAVPAVSLGPAVGREPSITPWREGVSLVDEKGVAIKADDIAEDSMMTAFPAGADRRELGSPVVVVRVDETTLNLPPGREDWAPRGILAFSQICTHAGCAIVLYRAPKYEPTTDKPALQCPCHYSTFAVREGAKPIFGPAERPLPQLPLGINGQGELVATGGLSGPVGPSWWGVRFE